MDENLSEKELKSDPLKYVTSLLKSKVECAFLLAPSFAAVFDYECLVKDLRSINVSKIMEVTFGAKIVNEEYHRLLSHDDLKNTFWISSTCPTVVSIIKHKFPDYVKHLMPVISPMHAMGKIAKKNYPNHKIIFIAPCIAKRIEAEEYSHEIDAVITIKELSGLIESAKTDGWYNNYVPQHLLHFDSFYNDYTKIYPLTGGLKASLHYKNILKEEEILVCDGVSNIENEFSSIHNDNIRFYDILSCEGGCIGGSCFGVSKSLGEKKQDILEYLKTSKEKKIGGEKIGFNKYIEGISLDKTF